MGDNTKIEWADATVNFWQGCKKVSKGCKYCYMYRDKSRYNQDAETVVRSKDETFYKALKWKEPRKIFTCSWSDFFAKEADQWREDAWKVIKDTPQHIWLILTKRPQRIKDCLPKDWGKKGYPNVWIGTSVESQKTADYRIPLLFEVSCAVRFLSVEPLLEPVNLNPFLAVQFPPDKKVYYPLHWVIVGGESGNETGDWLYRPCETKWIHDIVKQCQEKDVPVFVKQLGGGIAKQLALKDKAGGDFDEKPFPPYLRVREFPKILEND